MKKSYLQFTKKCKFCGSVFVKKANFGKTKWEKKKFCSKECSHKSQVGVTKLVHTKEFKEAVSKRHRGKKSSIETRRKMSKSKFGKNNPNWKGGISTEYQLQRASMECKLWRVAVFERDNYMCIWCNRKGGWSKVDKKQIALNADHIKPFKWYPE
jgi:hypothetical protein